MLSACVKTEDNYMDKIVQKIATFPRNLANKRKGKWLSPISSPTHVTLHTLFTHIFHISISQITSVKFHFSAVSTWLTTTSTIYINN